MIESWIDIPNIQTVSLPGSFRYVQSKSITSIYMNNNEWIDVSPILDNCVKISIINNSKQLNEIITNITNLIISSNSCNELSELNLREYRYLKSIEIGNDCFSNVDTCKIDGLNELKSLKIGMNSFTHLKSNGDKWEEDKVNNRSRSFSILNCNELESIEIGRFSFFDYAGGFELKNLPKLSTIKIGEIGSRSRNFYYSSFVIKGIIDMILLMNRSSTFEFHWIRWLCIPIFLINSDIKYLNDLNESIIDLPNLNSIELGLCALDGNDDSSCSLVMKSNIDWMNWLLDLPNLTSITSGGFSFYRAHSVTLSSMILNDWIMNRYS